MLNIYVCFMAAKSASSMPTCRAKTPQISQSNWSPAAHSQLSVTPNSNKGLVAYSNTIMPPKKKRKPKEAGLHNEAGSSLSLPTGVIAVAAMNNRSRMFVPGIDNTFAGMAFPHVMIDSGCNSLLLPLPHDVSALNHFAGKSYAWTVSTLSGTGASNPLTLTIKSKLLPHVGEMKLSVMSLSVPLPRLRFDVTKEAASISS